MSEYGNVDPGQHDAEERLGNVIRWVLLVAALIAAVGLLVPGGEPVATVSIFLVAAVPIARVAWLVVRWARIGDRRYMGAAAGLLVLIAAGPLIALLTS